MKAKLPLLIMPVVCLCLIGCRSAQLYHGRDSVFPSPEMNFSSAFIELDEHGELWDATQVSRAVDLINESEPVFLVTYIHGWKNNARFDNDNYRLFTNMLSGIAGELSGKPSKEKSKVVGIYIGWRGDTVLLKDPISWGARQLTFWGRRNAAERVAGTSATETLFSILQAANAQEGSKVVLIGHSMGGLILEKALSQAFVGSLLAQQGSNGPETNKAPANLVLLVNSAAPSIYARQLISMLRRLPQPGPDDTAGSNGKSFDRDHPLFVSITSKGDWATGKVFPIGMRFSALNKSFRNYDTNDDLGGKQLHYYTTTTGHNSALWSHKIKLIGKTQELATITQPGHQATQQTRQQETVKATLRYNMAPEMPTNTFTHRENVFRIAEMEEDKRKNWTPYWVMRVPTSIIRDHGDIFNDGFAALIGALLRRPEATDPGVPRRHIDPSQFKAQAQ